MRPDHVWPPVLCAVVALGGLLVGCSSDDELSAPEAATNAARPASSSGSSSGNEVLSVPEVDEDGMLTEVPVDQAAYFEDGQITLGEYEEAFQLFVDCAATAGGSVSVAEVDAVTGQIVFQSSEPVVAAGFVLYDNDGNQLPTPSNPTTSCYQRHYDQVKLWFDLRDPTVAAATGDEQVELFYEMMAPCLESNNVAVPSGLDASSSEFLRLQDGFEQLLAEGRCL